MLKTFSAHLSAPLKCCTRYAKQRSAPKLNERRSGAGRCLLSLLPISATEYGIRTIGYCFLAFPTMTLPVPVLTSRISLPSSTITKCDVEVMVPPGTGRTSARSPVQSGLTR
jgi:hypothetical protein